MSNERGWFLWSRRALGVSLGVRRRENNAISALVLRNKLRISHPRVSIFQSPSRVSTPKLLKSKNGFLQGRHRLGSRLRRHQCWRYSRWSWSDHRTTKMYTSIRHNPYALFEEGVEVLPPANGRHYTAHRNCIFTMNTTFKAVNWKQTRKFKSWSLCEMRRCLYFKWKSCSNFFSTAHEERGGVALFYLNFQV